MQIFNINGHRRIRWGHWRAAANTIHSQERLLKHRDRFSLKLFSYKIKINLVKSIKNYVSYYRKTIGTNYL